jgi:hypothetical protein
VAPASTPAPIHASWHDLVLTIGPYLVEARLPTLPGFDPGRALVRPTGTFVLLGSARISLVASPSAGAAGHPLVWVNRYTVERAEADLELSVFFPGAATSLSSLGNRPDPSSPDPSPPPEARILARAAPPGCPVAIRSQHAGTQARSASTAATEPLAAPARPRSRQRRLLLRVTACGVCRTDLTRRG